MSDRSHASSGYGQEYDDWEAMLFAPPRASMKNPAPEPDYYTDDGEDSSYGQYSSERQERDEEMAADRRRDDDAYADERYDDMYAEASQRYGYDDSDVEGGGFSDRSDPTPRLQHAPPPLPPLLPSQLCQETEAVDDEPPPAYSPQSQNPASEDVNEGDESGAEDDEPVPPPAPDIYSSAAMKSDAFAPAPPMGECGNCGRRFAVDRLGRH